MQISAQWFLKAEIFCDIRYSIFWHQNWIIKCIIKSLNSKINEIFLWNCVSSSNIAKHNSIWILIVFSNQISVVDLNFYYVHKEAIKLFLNIKIKTEMAFNVFDMNFCGEFSKNVKSNGIHIKYKKTNDEIAHRNIKFWLDLWKHKMCLCPLCITWIKTENQMKWFLICCYFNLKSDFIFS